MEEVSRDGQGGKSGFTYKYQTLELGLSSYS